MTEGPTPAPGAPAPDLREAGDRIEHLLDQLSATAPRPARDAVDELLRLVTDLYGGGLARIVALVGEADPALLDRLVADELVASLLLVHDLHPETLVARVAGALDRVRPMLAEHGGDVELLDVDEAVGAVRLQLLGNCDGCPSSSETLRHAVERAIEEAAPEVRLVEVRPEGPAPVPTPAAGAGPVPVTLSTKRRVAYDACPSGVGA